MTWLHCSPDQSWALGAGFWLCTWPQGPHAGSYLGFPTQRLKNGNPTNVIGGVWVSRDIEASILKSAVCWAPNTCQLPMPGWGSAS